MLKHFLFTASLLVLIVGSAMAQNVVVENSQNFRPALVNFDDYKELVVKVEEHRATRLINLDKFVEMSKRKDVVILDARSAYRFGQRHVSGAINLNFSDFTQPALTRLFPDPNTTILIYCNNNFEGDQENLMTKIVPRSVSVDKEIMLALNIPTYINLYGYGYRNIYELNELVNIKDSRIKFEGKAVR